MAKTGSPLVGTQTPPRTRRAPPRHVVLVVLVVFAILVAMLHRVAEDALATCRRSHPHRSHKTCRFVAFVCGHQSAFVSEETLLSDSPLRLAVAAVAVEAAPRLDVFFDAKQVDPRTLQMHYKLKVARNKPSSLTAELVPAVFEVDSEDDLEITHEFKKCLPESIEKDKVVFGSKCVDFAKDFERAKNGQWLTYKFKVLARTRKGNKKLKKGTWWNPIQRFINQSGNAKPNKKPSKKFAFIDQNVHVLKRPLLPWPFANEDGIWPPTVPNAIGSVAHNLQTFGDPYIHGGFDIRTEANATCYSPVSGKVVKVVQYTPDNDLYWSIMIRDEFDFIWQFHHLDRETFNVKEGDVIEAGHALGNVAFWPDMLNGANYHHTHMNVATAKPSWNAHKLGYPNPYVPGWTHFNPFSFLDHGSYRNSIPPSSEGVLYLFESTHAKKAFSEISHVESVEFSRIAGPVVKGTVHAVTHLISEFTPSNALPGYPYLQCPHEVVWFVSKRGKGNKAINAGDSGADMIPNGSAGLAHVLAQHAVVVDPTVLVRFDRIPPTQWPISDDAGYPSTATVEELFKMEFETVEGESMVSEFEYTTRRPFYSVTNTVRGQIGNGVGSGWDTTELKNGEYVFHVMARDWWGLWVHLKFPVSVKNKK
ncbi:hypothetical protein HDU98_001970 [Podochytrium sp. JEL0797]|nr:hypothetical protein HDU98_001970 [Podochytrium sp. JEL0797]